MGGFPLSRNFTCVYTHVIFNHVNKVVSSLCQNHKKILPGFAYVSTFTNFSIAPTRVQCRGNGKTSC